MKNPSTLNHQLPPDSLTPLHDGRPGLRRGLHAEVREPSATELAPSPGEEGRGEGGTSPSSSPDTRHPSPVLDFIASSEALDRYDEIISAGGWQLDNYRRNPVFQNAHQYGDVIFTLGKALITEVRAVAGRKVLFQRVEFATEVNPMAKIAYGLYKGKFLNAVSVGFIPLRWEDSPSSSSSSSSSNPRRKYLEQELLEVSAVGIPANPEALQLGLKAGAIEKADLRDLLDLLHSSLNAPEPAEKPSSRFAEGRARILLLPGGEGRGEGEPSVSPTHRLTHLPTHPFCSDQAAPNTHAGASGVRSHEAQLLQLARALRDALKR